MPDCKELVTLEPQPESPGCYVARFQGGVPLGSIEPLDDGSFGLWLDASRPGYYPAYVLRALADHMDRLEAEQERLAASKPPLPESEVDF